MVDVAVKHCQAIKRWVVGASCMKSLNKRLGAASLNSSPKHYFPVCWVCQENKGTYRTHNSSNLLKSGINPSGKGFAHFELQFISVGWCRTRLRKLMNKLPT